MSRSRIFSSWLVAAVVYAGVHVDTAEAAQPPSAHTIVVDGQRLQVTSRFYGIAGERRFDFAVPLPPATQIHGRDVTPLRDPDDHSIHGVVFAEPTGYPVVVEFEIPAGFDTAPIPIALPLEPGLEPGWQRIEIEGDVRLIPSVGAALPMHTSGYYAPGDFGVADRLRVDRDLDGRHPAGAAYLPAAMILEAGGVPGRLESGARRKRGLGVAAGVAFAGGLIALGLVFRRQESAIVAEQAEAFCEEFAAELRALDDTDPEARA